MATAGHVDHGKSALVLALTGTDPDRLEEEKRRGMTIDLGFACLESDGGRIAFIDVPGHLRFMRNMLAGVSGANAVLLVVAADDGPMPQTLEHLSVLRMLGVGRGVVAVTKCDLVDEDWLELVTEELRLHLVHSSLSCAPVITVSSRTGAGMDRLRGELENLLISVPAQPDQGGARLPVDRAFSIRGFGTVITGTLANGSVAVGDQLVLLPQGRVLKVRGLQQHNRDVARAYPGSRTAVNLASIERREVRRGDVLAVPDLLTVTTRFDTRIEAVPDAVAPLTHGDKVLLYHGTCEVAAQVLLLESRRLQPGDSGMAQLRLDGPLVAGVHDRFILRREPTGTVAGGVMLDLEPAPRRLRDGQALARLAVRASADVATLVREALNEARHGLTTRQLRQAAGAADAADRAIEELLAAGQAVRAGEVVLSLGAWLELERGAYRLIGAHHGRHPLDAGLSRAELRSQLGVSPPVLGALVQRLTESGTVTEADGRLALPQYVPAPSGADQQVIDAVMRTLAERPLAPPTFAELCERHSLTAEIAHYLIAQGTVTRASSDTLVLAQAWRGAMDGLRSYLASHRKINIGEARIVLGANRRIVVALLDELAGARETLRVGDVHWSRAARDDNSG